MMRCGAGSPSTAKGRRSRSESTRSAAPGGIIQSVLLDDLEKDVFSGHDRNFDPSGHASLGVQNIPFSRFPSPDAVGITEEDHSVRPLVGGIARDGKLVNVELGAQDSPQEKNSATS